MQFQLLISDFLSLLLFIYLLIFFFWKWNYIECTQINDILLLVNKTFIQYPQINPTLN